MPLPSTSVLADRHVRAKQELDALSLDALIVTTPTNIRYLSNHVGSAGILVLTGDAAHLLVDFRYQAAVAALQQSEAACPALRVWPVPGSYEDALLTCLGELGVERAGIEAGHMTVSRHEWLEANASSRAEKLSFRSTSNLVERLRMVKDAAEIAVLRESASRIDPVVAAALSCARAGVAERTVAAAIESAIREQGYERLAFDTIVASGPNSALPHHRAGDRLLNDGDLVVLDFGGVLDGYCCDLTRTVAIGAPSSRARELYEAVLEAQQAAISAVTPGILANDVDAAARRVLEDRGLGPAFGHGTGHGLGLDVHEEPRIGRPRQDLPPVTLQPGMVFTIEPGAYLTGFGGVRIEDDVLVTATGCEVLTRPDRALLTL